VRVTPCEYLAGEPANAFDQLTIFAGAAHRPPKEWHAMAQQPLTARQIKALRLINLGLSNQQIADKLSITVGTTKWHLHQIFSKLKVRSRTAAAAKGRRLGII